MVNVYAAFSLNKIESLPTADNVRLDRELACIDPN